MAQADKQVMDIESIGKKMVEVGLISSDQLAVALEIKKDLGGDLGRILVKKGFASESEISEFLQKVIAVPIVSLKDYSIDPEVIKIVPMSLAQKFHFMPLGKLDGALKIAMADPLDVLAIDDIRATVKLRIEPVIAAPEEVDKLLQSGYRLLEMSDESVGEVQSIGAEEYDTSIEAAERLKEAASGTKVIAEVNRIIANAVKKNASDIHLEPQERVLKLRFRIDGFLEEKMVLPKQMHIPVVTRIKIISGIDIAERRIPQDGRVRLKVRGKPLDMRISTYPTMWGEKVVMRLLTQETIFTLEDLGFTPRDKKCFEELIEKPHGVFLVTGPTGSGKTTTLYAALQRINSQDKNIVSIEDPIENEIVGINQAQINLRAGLTFASALRSILRQDPDVIMVGEVRDQETADIVVRSAITGHMVFSTLHTNTAIGAVTRLADLGIERFLISSSVIGLLSQRLVRKICPKCREETKTDPAKLKLVGLEANAKVYRGKGCKNCHMSGYTGRIGIFELVVVTPKLREMIGEGANEDKMIEEAKKEGTVDIREAGVKRILDGSTTVEEVLRVSTEG